VISFAPTTARVSELGSLADRSGVRRYFCDAPCHDSVLLVHDRTDALHVIRCCAHHLWVGGYNLCTRGLHAMQATTATANAKPELIEWLGPLWSKNFVDDGRTPLANTLGEVRLQTSAKFERYPAGT